VTRLSDTRYLAKFDYQIPVTQLNRQKGNGGMQAAIPKGNGYMQAVKRKSEVAMYKARL